MNEPHARNNSFNRSNEPLIHSETFDPKRNQLSDYKRNEKLSSNKKSINYSLKSVYPIMIVCLLCCIIQLLYLNLKKSQTEQDQYQKRLEQSQRTNELLSEQNSILLQIVSNLTKQDSSNKKHNRRSLPKKERHSYNKANKSLTKKQNDTNPKEIPKRTTINNNKTEAKESVTSQPSVKQTTKPKKPENNTDIYNPAINFQPYRLKPDTWVYSKNGEQLIRINKPLLVSMNMQKRNNRFEIKFESWVIQSLGNNVYSEVKNKNVLTIRRVNTRTAPILEKKYTIGVLGKNMDFFLIRSQRHHKNLWYQIIVNGYVKAEDLY